MNINIAKIIIVFGVLGLSIFVGLLIRISLKEPRSKSDQTLAPIKSAVEFTKPLSSSYKTNDGLTLRFPSARKKFEELNIPALPILKPDLKDISKEKSIPSAVTPFFENINKAVKKAEKSLMPDNTPTQNTSTVTSAGIILSLTKDQFHFLYPDSFIAGLIDAQNLFIKEQYPAYEPILKIETDTQVRLIEEKIVATLLTANIITKEKAEQFITTIRFTLPEMQLDNLQRYNSSGFYEHLPFSEFLSATLGIKESPQSAPNGLFLAGLLKKLVDALAHKAQAAVCGYCYDSLLCYRTGTGAPLPGYATIKFFCYCTGCYSSLGCLSSCNGAAIFDQYTGICGCG